MPWLSPYGQEYFDNKLKGFLVFLACAVWTWRGCADFLYSVPVNFGLCVPGFFPDSGYGATYAPGRNVDLRMLRLVGCSAIGVSAFRVNVGLSALGFALSGCCEEFERCKAEA